MALACESSQAWKGKTAYFFWLSLDEASLKIAFQCSFGLFLGVKETIVVQLCFLEWVLFCVFSIFLYYIIW